MRLAKVKRRGKSRFKDGICLLKGFERFFALFWRRSYPRYGDEVSQGLEARLA